MNCLAWIGLGATALALIAGCGGKVAIDSAGTGGTTTSSTTTTTTTGTGGSTPVKICGGKQGLPCDPDEWCQWDPPGSCGNFDTTGTCQPKPTTCKDEPCGFVPICGCDGNQYCNPCEAHMAGVDVDSTNACNLPQDEWAAWAQPTSAPRYVITKANFAADQCLAVFMVGFGMSITNIQVTDGWGVERIVITPHAKDCTLGPNLWPEPPEAVPAEWGEGSIKQDSTMWPCVVSVDAIVGWPAGSPSWVPGKVTLQANELVIQGACFDG